MRPYVICHMCTSIDGRIMGGRWGHVPGQKKGLNLFETTADTFNIPAWIVGTTTMKEFMGKNLPLKKAKIKIARGDHVGDPYAKRFAIGMDAKGVLRYQKGYVDEDHVVLILTERVSDDYLAHLQAAKVSYFICGKTEIYLPMALAKLRKTFGLKKIMAQGGGLFNGSMLHAGLVDEVSHIILPVVDGGIGIRGLLDIPGEAPPKAAAYLKLQSTKKLAGGATWFRYKVIGPAGK